MRPPRRRSVSLHRGFRVEGQKDSKFYSLPRTDSKIQNFFKMTSEKENERKVAKLKFFQKGIYVVALFILILLLLVQTIQCVVKFAKGPTYISSEIVPQKEAGFPALTICPESNKYKEDVLLAHGIASEKRYNYKTDLNWSSNQTGVTESELFHLASRNLSEIVKRVYIRYFKADEEGSTNVVLNLDDPATNPSIQEQRHRGFGRCYTLYPAEDILKLGVYYYKMDFYEDVKVYFHRNGQFLDLSGRMGYKIYIKDKVQSQVIWHDIRMMSKDKDGGKTCIDSEYDQCMYSALIHHMKSNTPSENGCTVPWVINGTEGATKICKDPENINTTFWIAWNRVTNQKDDCPVPCDTLLVSLGAKNYELKEDRDYGQLYLYFAPRTMFSEELTLYTPLSMFAEIGGYVGLLLGVSLWNFASLISDMLEVKIKKIEEPISLQSSSISQVSPRQ